MVLRFALRSLLRRPVIAALLVFCLSIALGLPGAIRGVVAAFGREIESRSQEAPLVLGATGSKTDLVLHALFFGSPPPGEITVADWQALADHGPSATTAPLCVKATVDRMPVIGTNGAYFHLRGLRLTAGKPITRLGDAVLGAEAAQRLGVVSNDHNDHIDTDVESLFTLSGGVPVRLRVAGVLTPTGTADDASVFVSLETAWLIAGLGHSHANPSAAHDDVTEENSMGSAIEVTDENIDRFHFHGRRERFPLTAVLIKPSSERSRLLLVGRYFDQESVQLVEADRVLKDLFAVALRLQRLFEANAALTGMATLLLSGAVIALVIRLRWSEVTAMSRIGFPRTRIALLFGAEFAAILILAFVIALLIALMANQLAPTLLRWLIL